MNNRKKALLNLLVSLCILMVGFVFAYPEKLGICAPEADYSCIFPLSENYGQPIGQTALFGLIPVSLLLLIFPLAWNAWKKFALWYIPLAALIIVSMPISGGTSHMSGIDKEVTTWFLAVLYVIVSVVIIARAALKKRNQTNL